MAEEKPTPGPDSFYLQTKLSLISGLLLNRPDSGVYVAIAAKDPNPPVVGKDKDGKDILAPEDGYLIAEVSDLSKWAFFTPAVFDKLQSINSTSIQCGIYPDDTSSGGAAHGILFMGGMYNMWPRAYMGTPWPQPPQPPFYRAYPPYEGVPPVDATYGRYYVMHTSITVTETMVSTTYHPGDPAYNYSHTGSDSGTRFYFARYPWQVNPSDPPYLDSDYVSYISGPGPLGFEGFLYVWSEGSNLSYHCDGYPLFDWEPSGSETFYPVWVSMYDEDVGAFNIGLGGTATVYVAADVNESPPDHWPWDNYTVQIDGTGTYAACAPGVDRMLGGSATWDRGSSLFSGSSSQQATINMCWGRYGYEDPDTHEDMPSMSHGSCPEASYEWFESSFASYIATDAQFHGSQELKYTKWGVGGVGPPNILMSTGTPSLAAFVYKKGNIGCTPPYKLYEFPKANPENPMGTVSLPVKHYLSGYNYSVTVNMGITQDTAANYGTPNPDQSLQLRVNSSEVEIPGGGAGAACRTLLSYETEITIDKGLPTEKKVDVKGILLAFSKEETGRYMSVMYHDGTTAESHEFQSDKDSAYIEIDVGGGNKKRYNIPDGATTSLVQRVVTKPQE